MASNSWPIYSAKLEFNAKYKLPVQFDTAIEINLTNEKHADEDDAFAKVSTLPTGLLAVRVFGCIGLSTSDFKIDDDIFVYARVIAGANGKNTNHQSFAKGKPIWNECLFFPVQLTGNPKSTSNRLTILIIWRDEAQDKKVGLSRHKLLGKAEFFLYKLAKHTKTFETVDITNRKQQVVGQLQIEMAMIYGPFGYGLSSQLENHLHQPTEMVQISFYPKVAPSIEGSQCRGHSAIPRKISHPSFIPFNEKVNRLEPAISETYGNPVTMSRVKFPFVVKSMTRLPGLQLGLQQQKTRTKRVAYLRGVLRSLDKVDGNDEKNSSNQSKLPEKIALPSGSAVEGNDALKALTVRKENQGKENDSTKASIPTFATSLDSIDRTGDDKSSQRDSVSSLQLTTETIRRHHRRSSILTALFESE